MAESKMRRIGVRIHQRPERGFILGYSTEVYDVDTGDYLPAERADLHFSPDSLVTATMTVTVAEVQIVEDEKPDE